MPVRKVKGGYRWGKHGKFTSREPRPPVRAVPLTQVVIEERNERMVR